MSTETRAAISGILVALMLMLLVVIRLDPAASSSNPQLTSVSAKTLPTFWVVKPGQTFAVIAAQTGLSLTALENLNPYVDPGTLQVGEQIRLHASKSGSSASALASVKLPGFWVIAKGQTLSLIADRTGLSVWQIEGDNPHLNPGDLQIGERVSLHAPAPKPAGGSGSKSAGG